MSDFIKFPHTPHLVWLDEASPRNDKLLSKDEACKFLKGNVIIEEKVDGANIGFSLSAEGEILVQNRGNYLGRPGHPQFSPLWPWVAERGYMLKDALGKGLILFGEWCFARHSVFYDRLPDWFLAFDVFDIADNSFWSVKRRNELAKSLGIATVPKIAQGKFSPDEIIKLPVQSKLTDGPMEGVYLRKDDDSILVDRAKVVRAEFTQSISTHWSKKALQKNKLKS